MLAGFLDFMRNSGLDCVMDRRPRGYDGRNHETIGSDILSVLQVVTMPEHVLGHEMTARLRTVKPDGWYPISWLLETMDALAAKLGHFALVQMGRNLFRLSHEQRVKQVARSAADIIYGMDDMYHHANRGERIGGWEVLSFLAGRAQLDKTTPHHCAMEEGILSQALLAMGVPALVVQGDCFRKGADSCIYVVSSSITDERWMGDRSPRP
jgi:hypothetical protein